MDALSALRLQIEWGADEALEDEPLDRTRVRLAASNSASPSQKPGPVPATLPRKAPVARAEAAAAAAQTLNELRAALMAFTDCPLSATATNLVFNDGNPNAGLVLVGEAPGEEEDLQGRPFVGASGRFLDRMLASIGLDRTKLLIVNLIPWRPPGNRSPTDNEILLCLPFLRRHLELASPRVVVSLGALSTRALTGSDSGIRKLRGKWRELQLGQGTVRHLPMLHPAYLLRTPGAKRDAWLDLLILKDALR